VCDGALGSILAGLRVDHYWRVTGFHISGMHAQVRLDVDTEEASRSRMTWTSSSVLLKMDRTSGSCETSTVDCPRWVSSPTSSVRIA
jgi:hypothetical protein